MTSRDIRDRNNRRFGDDRILGYPAGVPKLGYGENPLVKFGKFYQILPKTPNIRVGLNSTNVTTNARLLVCFDIKICPIALENAQICHFNVVVKSFGGLESG